MKGKNKNGRTNWIGVVLVLVVLVGMAVFVGAKPAWNSSAYNTIYYFSEDTTSYHNFTMNLSDSSNLSHFEILSISWVEGSLGPDHSDFYWLPWNDSGFSNSTSGVLRIDSGNNNDTGNFTLNVQAQGAATGASAYFNFIINATNDAPNFTLDSNYNTQVPTVGNTSLNISLVGSDEEEQYPLVYNVSFNNCSFASWSDRNNSDCNLSYDMFSSSNTTSIFALNNLTYNDVGSYNLTICTTDNVNGTSLPSHYDSDYTENKTTCYNTTLDLLSSLSIDASDCDGSSWTEGNTLSCTINITTIGATDSVTISAPASFKNDAGAPHDVSWFYASQSVDDELADYMISVPISISLGKEEVGNWTIAFSADDGSPTEEPRPVSENISIFVDYVESNVSLAAISDLNGSNALYANHSFQINATDDDLLIWDDSVKDETFNFESNVSWVTVSDFSGADSTINYWLSDVYVDHSYVLNNASLGEGNYSVNISVTDNASNLDWKVFVVEIRNDTAPEWASLPDPVVLLLTEDEAFSYNVSINVSDAEGDPISFYYENESAPFCSLTAGNFNSNGMISFTPTDCDVGYHDVTIIASDGKLNSSYSFNFTVANVLDNPLIEAISDVSAVEGEQKDISFQVDDFDYLIPDGQSSFYDEDLTVDLTIINLTVVTAPISFDFISLGTSDDGTEFFQATFTPDEENVGYYNITVNVSDAGGLSNVTYFTLNITQVNDAPVLTSVENQTTTSKRVFYLDVNATDEEDDLVGKLLNYSLDNLTVGGNFLTIGLTTGVINVTMNESLAGFYEYNLSVNDSDGAVDWQVFSLTVHGTPNITSPADGYVFNWTEAVEIADMEFEVDYEINGTSLTYEFYLDRIVYSNLTAYNYTNLSDELRNSTNYTWVDNANYTWNFTPNYTDETYGMLKNFTLVVSNAEFSELNTSLNWKVNVTHTNENISFTPTISKKGPVTRGTAISVDLEDYFSDEDYFDAYHNQLVNFTLETVGEGGYVVLGSSFDGWILSLSSSTAVVETVKITAYEWSDENVSLGSAESNDFEVEFTEPEVVTTPTSGGGSTVKLKHFSLKLIMPQDIILSDQNYIEVPFSLQNTGGTDLTGIHLWSEVLYNNAFSDDIKVLLEDTYIESLKIGQSENYTLKVYADTQRSGRYKVSIFANVTSPKFSDWGDFFIDLQKTNESEAEQILLFTEQFITDNPECLELTEVLSRAQEAFDLGDISTALNLAEEVTVACEDAILANEQIRYSVEGFVERNFYYISFATLAIFLIGLIFYIYKRVRFNKYEEDYNV